MGPALRQKSARMTVPPGFTKRASWVTNLLWGWNVGGGGDGTEDVEGLYLRKRGERGGGWCSQEYLGLELCRGVKVV
jgi:hypothetical protein